MGVARPAADSCMPYGERMGSSLKQMGDGGQALVVEHAGELGHVHPDVPQHARERRLGAGEELVEEAQP
eukprot:scaffold48836_cov97-Phaeocystis_antarctica.AAC.1